MQRKLKLLIFHELVLALVVLQPLCVWPYTEVMLFDIRCEREPKIIRDAVSHARRSSILAMSTTDRLIPV